jgi:hypothetical protein
MDLTLWLGMKIRITKIENDYANLWYYPDEKIIHHKFLQPIYGENFQSVLTTGLDLMREHGARKWLSDDRLNSILPAQDSAWSQDHWLPLAYQAGWKYWAVLPPVKARGRINMARLMAFVGKRKSMKIEIFSDPDEAWLWLSKQGRGSED